MIPFDDERLHAVLTSVGDHLRVDAAPRTSRRSTSPLRPSRLVLVAAMILVVMAVSIVVAPVRRTVADWLGIGETDVVVDPSSASAASSLPSIVVGVEPVSADTAAQLIGRSLPDLDDTELGAPSGLARMPEGGVLVIWGDASTLWIRAAGDPVPGQMRKMTTTLAQAVEIDALGEEALAITGDHMLVTPHRRLAASTVVLWRSDGLELRLEGDRSVDALVALAREIEGAR
jgi:hypothetical protein